MTHQVCCCNKPANEDTGVCNWPPVPPNDLYGEFQTQQWAQLVKISFSIPIGYVGNITNITAGFWCTDETPISAPCGNNNLFQSPSGPCPSELRSLGEPDNYDDVAGYSNQLLASVYSWYGDRPCTYLIEDGYRDFSFVSTVSVINEADSPGTCKPYTTCPGENPGQPSGFCQDRIDDEAGCPCTWAGGGGGCPDCCLVGNGCIWGVAGVRCREGGNCGQIRGCVWENLDETGNYRDATCPTAGECGGQVVIARKFSQTTVSGCVPIGFTWTGRSSQSGGVLQVVPRNQQGGGLLSGEFPDELKTLCCLTGPEPSSRLVGPFGHEDDSQCPNSFGTGFPYEREPTCSLLCADTLYAEGTTTFGFEGINSYEMPSSDNRSNPIRVTPSSGKSLLSIEFGIICNPTSENLQVVDDKGAGNCIPDAGQVVNECDSSQVIFDAEGFQGMNYGPETYNVKVFYEGFPTTTGINFRPARVFIEAPGHGVKPNGDFVVPELVPNANDFGSFFVSTNIEDWVDIT